MGSQSRYRKELKMGNIMNNWRTTLMGFIPAVPYLLQWFGFWPSVIPLPPFEQVWPTIAGVLGVGVIAKDSNVTGVK